MSKSKQRTPSKASAKVSVGLVSRAGANTFRFECGIKPIGRILIEGRNEWLAKGAGPAIGELFGQLCSVARDLDPDGFNAAQAKLQAAWEQAIHRFAEGEQRIKVTK